MEQYKYNDFVQYDNFVKQYECVFLSLKKYSKKELIKRISEIEVNGDKKYLDKLYKDHLMDKLSRLILKRQEEEQKRNE